MIQRQRGGRCPVCKALDAACGPSAPAPLITSDWGEVTPMQGGPLKVYDVKVGTTTVQMRLSDEDARKRGLLVEEQTMAAEEPKPKRRAKNKKTSVEDEASGGE